MIRDTIKGLAAKLGVQYQTAQGLVKFLAETKQATEVGVEKAPSGKGKGSTVWEIPESLTLNLSTSTMVVKEEEVTVVVEETPAGEPVSV